MSNPNHKPTSLTLPDLSTLTLNRNENRKIVHTHVVEGMQVILETSYYQSEFIRESPPESVRTNPFEIPDMTNYDDRLSSFKYGEWCLPFIKPTQMARAGFYYQGMSDNVKCEFCSLELSRWEPGDDPLVKHELESPRCQFIKEKDWNVICMHDSPLTEENLLEWKDDLENIGHVNRTNSVVLQKFSKIQARLSSFDKCYMRLKQDSLLLCEAGFFYIGDGTNDASVCFYCFLGYQNWEDDDDPWAEHARLSPLCGHVLLCKGFKFVENACGAEREGLKSYHKQMVALGIFTNDVVYSIDENPDLPESTETVVSSTESTESTEIVNVRPRILLKPEQTDLFICKICLDEKMTTLFLPCSHIFACVQCAISLDQCAVCREPSTMTMRIILSIEEDNDLACAPLKQFYAEPTDSALCKVCHKEEIRAAIMPCTHVYACLKCAKKMKACLVCFKNINNIIPVFL